MNYQTLLALAMLCAATCTPAQAEDRKKIGVEVAFGATYANVLGNAAALEAKNLAESGLVIALSDVIKYFDFVPGGETANHKLSFKIAHPPAETPGLFENIHDYYVFLSLQSNSQKKGETLHWLFRDAASNLNGVDSAQSIAVSLNKHVKETRHERNTPVIETLPQEFITRQQFKVYAESGLKGNASSREKALLISSQEGLYKNVGDLGKIQQLNRIDITGN
ncbi:MAG: hypothetical protein GY875_22105 [Gammaproteobacteria bacterium]|nr:hypothetical protein [Gammaproteobacteria bacterium]